MRGPYLEILGRGCGSTDRAKRGSYCHNWGPIFPSVSWASSVSKLFIIWHSVSDSKMKILDLLASLQNKNTRVGPFPWKWSVLQNPDRERTNQSTGICLRLGLPYNNRWYNTINVHNPDNNRSYRSYRRGPVPLQTWVWLDNKTVDDSRQMIPLPW